MDVLKYLKPDLTTLGILLLAGFTLPVLYVLGVCVYRLTIHPFAKYPGPFWAKISYFHAFYHAWIQDTAIDQFACHEKYGPIVRYTPDNTLFSQVPAQKDIHGAGKNFRKGKAYAPMNAQPGVANLAFTPHKREHARRRRIIGQGFTDASMREADPHVKAHIVNLCTQLLELPPGSSPDSRAWTRPKNMADWLFWMGMDITTDLIFGQSYSMLIKPDMRFAGVAVQKGLRRNSLCAQYPALFQPGVGAWLDFGTWFLPSSLHMMQNFLAIGTETALERFKAEKQRKDILSHLIGAVDPETGTKFTRQDVIMEANILLLAGGDTTGTSLCTTIFYLSRNAHAYAKLASEIRSTFASGSEIGLGPKLDSCTYLRACIEEGLRLSGGSAFWRDADEGGATVVGEFIPAGLTVGFSTYAVHHDPDVFPEPFAYRPERWIPSDEFSVEQVDHAKSACNKFSIGPRSCVAKNLAMTMMLLTVATVIYEMEFRIADGELGKVGEGRPGLGKGRERKEEYQLYGSFTQVKDGPWLQFRKRELGSGVGLVGAVG